MEEQETTMVFATDIKVQQNNKETLRVPDMTLKCMVPYKLEFYEVTGPRDARTTIPAKDLICRIFAGGELCALGEPFFRESNQIDLTPYIGFIERHGRINIDMFNKDKTIREFRVVAHYMFSHGGVLYQERCTGFENVISNIAKAGRCTKLSITFSRVVDSVSFLTTSSCTTGDWIESFSADGSKDPDEVYLFDFVSPELSAYMDYFDYLSLKVKCDEPENGQILQAYITAWGFPHNK